MARGSALLLLGTTLAAAAAQDVWTPVRELIDSFPELLIPGVHMTVSTLEDGVVFNHSKGGVTEDTAQQIWSSTKWITGAAIMREVEMGNLNLDAPISNQLPYWPVDPNDSRSGLTLRHLLGFASGYTDITQSTGYLVPLVCLEGLQACAEQVFLTQTHQFLPGEVIDYNRWHFPLCFCGFQEKCRIYPCSAFLLGNETKNDTASTSRSPVRLHPIFYEHICGRYGACLTVLVKYVTGAVVERALGEPIYETINRNVFQRAGGMPSATFWSHSNTNPFLVRF